MVDKKLRSKIALTYNTGLKDQNSDIVTGKILNVGHTRNFTMITVQFAYFDSLGAEIQRSAWTIEGADEINQLFADITPYLPPLVDEATDTMNKFYTGFMFVAAEGWGTPITDWELIDDVV
jgi:hypothetical protein